MSCGKIPFDDKTAALTEIKIQHAQHIRFSKRAKHNKKSNIKVHCYECRRCGKWHLTTQSRNKQKRY